MSERESRPDHGIGSATARRRLTGLRIVAALVFTSSALSACGGEDDIIIGIGIDPVLPNAEVGVPYAVALHAEHSQDSLGEIRWALVESFGGLPGFLSLDPQSGILSGTPDTVGFFYFTVELISATDETFLAGQEFELTVSAGEEVRFGSALYIESSSPLPMARIDESYSASLAARNVEGTSRWSSPNLPAGLALDSVTGVVSGSPEESGHFCIAVSAAEVATPGRADEKIFSLTILPRGTSATPLAEVDAALARLDCGDLVFTAPEAMRLHETRELTLAVSLDRTIAHLRRLLAGVSDIAPLVAELEDDGAATARLEESLEAVDLLAGDASADSVDRQAAVDDVRDELEELEAQGFDVAEISEDFEDVEDIIIRSTLISATVRFADRMKADLTGSGFAIEPLNALRQPVSKIDVTEWRWRVTALEPASQELRLVLSAVLRVEGDSEELVLETFVREIEVDVTFWGRVAQIHKEHWQWIWGTALIPIVALLSTMYTREASPRGRGPTTDATPSPDDLHSGSSPRPPALRGGNPESAISGEELAIDVFVSYSREDQDWKDDLITMIEPLTRSCAVSVWSDDEIAPGSEWYESITNAITRAKVAVLLVTKDFLASEFIVSHELPRLLARADNDELTVVWVLVSACQFDETDIVKYQAAHDVSVPLNQLPEADRDAVWVEITDHIKDALAVDERSE